MKPIWRWIVSALALIAMLAYGNFAYAQTQSQTLNPATCVNDASIGTTAWTAPANAEVSDNAFATDTSNGSTALVTQYIKCTGYGFTIPATATITGITVNVERLADTANHYQDEAMRMVNAGVIGSTDRSTTTTYPTTDTYEAHGGSTDLWGTTWTPASINSATFGAAFAAQEVNSTHAHTVSVDNIQITVSYTMPFSCTPPSNTPSNVTLSCVCDTFGRTTLNPSTIYGANWSVSTSDQTGILPSIVNQGYLQLTNNTGNNAKAATVPGIFPASGNYISVEFQHYAYDTTSGTGADGLAVTLSDYSVPAVPGAFGGSLGYAQKTGTACNTASCPGFAGGWVGIGLDEFGNYQNPTEGRIGGPGAVAESVGLRGSGSGVNGYNFIAGTTALSPTVDDAGSTTPAYGYYYQVIVDARNDPTATSVTVNRNTGSGYTSLISVPNIYSAATAQGFTQSAVPANWQISFTASTGGDNNIHAIGGLRICAQSVEPPSGGTPGSFNAVDSAYGNASVSPGVAVQNYLTGHIYMKLVGTPFAMNVAALSNSQILTTYAASSAKTVTVRLVSNPPSDGYDCTLSCTSTCTGKSTISDLTPTQTLTFASGATNKGQLQTGNFVLNEAWQRLVAIISDGSTTACSTDNFSVRPLSLSIAASGNATMHAGKDPFTVTATTAGIAGYSSNYNGTLTANTGAIAVVSPATNLGSVAVAGAFPAATIGTPSSTASATFTYSDVGSIVLDGVSATTPAFVDDETWTSVDSVNTKNDCNISTTNYTISYSNTIDSTGKYGCYFGNLSSTTIGRFIPDHFVLSAGTIVNRSDLTNSASVNGGIGPNPASVFTYLGEPVQVQFTLTAVNAGSNPTLNYFGSLAQFTSPVSGVGTGTNSLGLWGFGSAYTVGTGTCNAMLAHAATAGSYPTSFANCLGGAVAPTAIACLTTGINCSATNARITAATPSFTAFASGVSTFTTNLTIGRADLTDGPYNTFEIGAVPTDGDGVTLAASALNVDTDTSGVGTAQRQLLGSTEMFYGRLKLGNAYGSELMPLWVPVTAQYVKSFSSVSPTLLGPIFATNVVDSATTFTPKSNLSMGAYTGTLSSSNLTVANNIATSLYSVTTAGTTTAALFAGLANIEVLRPTGSPTPTGSAFLALTLGNANTNENCVVPALSNATSGASLPFLQWSWWCAGKLDPNAQITFGTSRSRFIYLRENY